MKKDIPRQARRQRALDRFTILPRNGESTDDYAKYIQRKEAELASLKRALGTA